MDAWEAITLKADPSYQLSVQDMLSQLRAFDTPAQRGGSIGVHKAAMWLHIPIIAPEALRTPRAAGSASPSDSASRGRSRSTSWRCRAMVAVEMTTGSSVSTARAIAGTR